MIPRACPHRGRALVVIEDKLRSSLRTNLYCRGGQKQVISEDEYVVLLKAK